jgi:hypothetical protein
MKIKKRSQFPKCIRHFKEVKAIYVGKCPAGHLDDKHVGHAHCDPSDPYYGSICLRYKYLLKQRLTLLHEVAHLIANTDAKVPPHGKKWREALLAIGGTFKSFSYTHNGIISTNIDYTYRPRQW